MPGESKPQESVDFETFRSIFETKPAEVLANMAICLIHQANYLLDQQIKHLEKEFLKEGGIRERMTHTHTISLAIGRIGPIRPMAPHSPAKASCRMDWRREVAWWEVVIWVSS